MFLSEERPKSRAVFVYANPANGTGFVGRRSSVQICPPQPILLIHKGFRISNRKPLFFFLGRNHFSLIPFWPARAEKLAQLFRRRPLVLRKRVSVNLRYASRAVAYGLLTNLLRDSQRIHRCYVCVAEGMKTERCCTFLASRSLLDASIPAHNSHSERAASWHLLHHGPFGFTRRYRKPSLSSSLAQPN